MIQIVESQTDNKYEIRWVLRAADFGKDKSCRSVTKFLHHVFVFHRGQCRCLLHCTLKKQ